MDHDRFDALSRRLGTPGTRRSLLGTLAALGAALGRGLTANARDRLIVCVADDGTTRRVRCGGRCNGKVVCCGDGDCGPRQRCQRHRCVADPAVCRDRDCPGDLRCRDGQCQCPANRKRCGTRCVPQGGCCSNAACADGQTCRQGTCTCTANSCAGCCDGDTCVSEGGCCSGNRICQSGSCTTPVATLEDCQGQCAYANLPATTTVCGATVSCPNCAECTTLGCNSGAFSLSSGPRGAGRYCTTGGPGQRCNPGTCPDGSGCAGGICMQVCTGTAGA